MEEGQDEGDKLEEDRYHWIGRDDFIRRFVGVRLAHAGECGCVDIIVTDEAGESLRVQENTLY